MPKTDFNVLCSIILIQYFYNKSMTFGVRELKTYDQI